MNTSKEETRTKKAAKNTSVFLFNKLIMLIFAFVVRTVFIKILGADYTGVNSLYSNVLSVLSLADLGMGSICSFYLYKALADNDEHQVYLISIAFKKIYRVIMIVLTVIGLSLIPFLRYIVKSELDSKHLIIYYILFLANNIFSYAFTYRIQVMYADQKQYIINIANTVVMSILYTVQIIFLILTKNYYIYLILQIVFTVINGLVANTIVCKQYPFLCDGKYSEVIYKIEGLEKNLSMTFMGKVSSVMMSQTDSILISTIINTITVGFYTNYYILLNYIINFFGVFVTGIVSSFGNLQTENDKGKSYKLFNVLLVLFGMLGTFCSACFFCVIKDFVIVWIGKKYVMSDIFALALVIAFFVQIIEQPIKIYRDTLGIFKKGQFARLFAAAVNIVLSIVLGYKYGLVGIIIATPISKLLTYFWYDGIILMKYLNKSISIYFVKIFWIFITTSVSVYVSYYLCNRVDLSGLIAIFIKILICLIVFVFIEFPAFWNSELKIWIKEKLNIRRA